MHKSTIAKTDYCMKKFLVLIFFTGCFCTKMFAQQFIVTGSVVDEYGRALSNVSIHSKKTNASVMSAGDGLFTIQSQANDVLLFSYPNFKEEITSVKNASTIISIKLTPETYVKPDSTDVLYESKSNNKILGSVSTINTNQLTTTPGSLYAYALTGRLPGLYS